MIYNKTGRILAERGQNAHALYNRIVGICDRRGEKPPCYNSVLSFVRNSNTINKRIWELAALALRIDPVQMFSIEEDK